MKKKFLVILLLLFSLTLTGCGGESNNTNTSNNGSNSGSNTNSNSNHEQTPRELTASEKMIVSISELISEGLAYDTGNYIKGDITPGEYAFVKIDGSGSYYSEEDAAGNIVDNENFDSFGYVKVHGVGNLETRGVLISVSAFERLNVTGAKQIYEILNNQTDYNQGGYYKVGADIEPGQYVLESIGGRGYYAIMSGPVSNSDIIKNDNFNGRASVSLKSGQYLDLSRSTFTKQN